MKNIISLFLISLTALSCKESEDKKLLRQVREWQGKTILFPDSMPLTSYGEDTVITQYRKKLYPYTILNYVDTIGCVSCRLQLSRWKSLIKELQTDYPDKVNCLMVFYSNQKRRFIKYLQNNEFDSFVFMDDTDTLNKMNNFLQGEDFRTFLLDENNKVKALGNPVLNPKIRNLYLSIISDGKAPITSKRPLAEVDISTNRIDFGDFPYEEKQETEIVITNVGVNLLVIDDIVSSCSCITVKFEKKKIRVGESVMIKIIYQGNAPELLNERLDIFCNIPKAPLSIKIMGNAKNE